MTDKGATRRFRVSVETDFIHTRTADEARAEFIQALVEDGGLLEVTDTSLADTREGATAAIENALYALNPDQGERADPSAASMWLRTTLPADHPNYLTWEYVEQTLGWSYATR